MRTTIQVTGMTCNHCVHSVQSALEGVPGVRSARVDLQQGRAVVDHDENEATLRDMAAAVAEAGYQAEEAA